MQNTMTGFDAEHISFTLANSFHSHTVFHNTRFYKKFNFITESPRTSFGLNSFSYLCPRFSSSVPKKMKKKEFKCSYKNLPKK